LNHTKKLENLSQSFSQSPSQPASDPVNQSVSLLSPFAFQQLQVIAENFFWQFYVSVRHSGAEKSNALSVLPRPLHTGNLLKFFRTFVDTRLVHVLHPLIRVHQGVDIPFATAGIRPNHHRKRRASLVVVAADLPLKRQKVLRKEILDVLTWIKRYLFPDGRKEGVAMVKPVLLFSKIGSRVADFETETD
jgi:hypothetical protein